MSTSKINKHDVDNTILSEDILGVLQNWTNSQCFPFLGKVTDLDTLDGKLYELGEGTIYSCRYIESGTNFLVIGYLHLHGGGYGSQIRMGYGTKVLSVRYLDNGTWQDWESFLPLTGGTLSGNAIGLGSGHAFVSTSGSMLDLKQYNDPTVTDTYNALRIAKPADSSGAYMVQLQNKVNGVSNQYVMFGGHNKPSGSYTGNGNATARTITTNGLGSALMVWSNTGFSCLVTYNVAWCFGSSSQLPLDLYEVHFRDGVLTLTTTNDVLNRNGTTYYYQVL